MNKLLTAAGVKMTFFSNMFEYVYFSLNITGSLCKSDKNFKKSVNLTIEISIEMSYIIHSHRMFIFLKGNGSTDG